MSSPGARVHRAASTGSTASPPWRIDLSAADGPAQLIQRAIEEHGQVDVLVNNVGAVRMRTRGIPRHQRRGFRLGDADELLHRAAGHAGPRSPRMAARGAGAIVNVASVNAFFQPDAATIDYGAAKAALVNLTKTLAQEFGPRGIQGQRRVSRAREHRPVARRARRGRDRGEGHRRRTPTPPARRSSPGSAGSPPAASPRPRRSPR